MHAVQMHCLYLSPAKDIRGLSTVTDIDIRHTYVWDCNRQDQLLEDCNNYRKKKT